MEFRILGPLEVVDNEAVVSGYSSLFYNSEIGSYFSYATDERNMILIITKNRKYVISCEKPNELLSRFI